MEHEEFIRMRNRLFDLMLVKPVQELLPEIASFNHMMTRQWDDQTKAIHCYEQIENYQVLPFKPLHDKRLALHVLLYEGKRLKKTKTYYFVNRYSVSWEIEDSEEHDVIPTNLDRLC